MKRKDTAQHIPLPKEFEKLNIPLIQSEEVTHCPVCKESDYVPYAYGYDYEIRTCKNEWRFVKCNSCDHVWLNPRPAISELALIYPSTYYAYNYEKNVNKVAVWGKNLLDKMKFKTILRYFKGRPKSYCDIGCGSGRFLRLMKKKGVAEKSNYGIELNADSIKELKKDGFQVYVKRVEDCKEIPDGSIDLITMFHVIEHVDDPSTVLRKLAALLSNQGIIAIETPNIDSLDADKYKQTYWGGYHIPRHWNLFKIETLSRLLDAQGLEVVTIKFQTGHSFWMYSNHHLIRYGKGNIMKSKKFDPFKGNLLRLIGFTLRDKWLAFLGAKTSAMLVIARKKR